MKKQAMSFSLKGSWNDKATLSIPCPECGYKTKQLISKLQKTKSFVCGECGKTVIIEGDDLAALEEFKKSILQFK